MKARVKKRDRMDHKILFVVAALVAYGLVMIYSVTIFEGKYSAFKKQAIGMGVCFLLMMTFYHLDLRLTSRRWGRTKIFKKYIIPVIYVGGYLSILMLMIPNLGVTRNGATRWIKLGPVNVQVAEFVKIAVILMLAAYAEKHARLYRNETGYNAAMLFMGAAPAVLLLVISNDLSSSVVIVGITFALCFLSCRGKGSIWFYIILAALILAAAAGYLLYIKKHMPDEALLLQGKISFRDGRIGAWFDPERYAKSVGFQPLHCLYALANGGWFGKGLGQGWQKGILPESENDVIFAVILEELGIVGGVILLFLFVVLITLLYKVADRTDAIYEKMIVVGIVIHIILQVLIHCAVSTNSIPNTGIGLPFISSGISAAFCTMVEMTLVLWIAKATILDPAGERTQEMLRRRREKRQEKRRKKEKKKTQKETGNVRKIQKLPQEALPANVAAFPGRANSGKRKHPPRSAAPSKPLAAGEKKQGKNKKKTSLERDEARKAALRRVTGHSGQKTSNKPGKSRKNSTSSKKGERK